jgi:hypothetical protein
MMPARDGLKRIADTISRKRDIAAVLVPRRMALALVDEMYPNSTRSDFDGVVGEAFDLVVDKARSKYIRLVSAGGYIGTVMSVPMIVADDVVICSLTEEELVDSAHRLGVDMSELGRDRRRAGAA